MSGKSDGQRILEGLQSIGSQKVRSDWERLEISSRKLEIPREHFMQGQVRKRTKIVRTYYKQKRLRRSSKNTEKCTKKILMSQITTMI